MESSNSILDMVELEPKPIGIGGARLEILAVKDIGPIISELEAGTEDAVSSFPFWVKIWEASIVLTAHLAELGLDKNLDVLEVGAGMGITGMFMGAFGHHATLTDFNEDALKLLEKNRMHNSLETVRIEQLDWHNPSVERKYDIICGSELIYRESDVEPLIKVLRSCIKPDGTIYLAHDINRMSMIAFLAKAGKHFDIEHAGKSFTGKDQKKQIVVHTLTPK